MTTSSTPKFTNRIAQNESTTAGPFTEEQSHHSSTDFVAPFTRNLIPLSDEQGHDARQRHKTLQQVQGKSFSSSEVEAAAAAAGTKTDVHTDSDIQQVGPQTLDPKAKSVLVRRSRKIEQVLGQTLTEPEAGRQVVDPVQRSEQAIVSHTQADWSRRGSDRDTISTLEDGIDDSASFPSQDSINPAQPRVDEDSALDPTGNTIHRLGSPISRTPSEADGKSAERHSDQATRVDSPEPSNATLKVRKRDKARSSMDILNTKSVEKALALAAFGRNLVSGGSSSTHPASEISRGRGTGSHSRSQSGERFEATLGGSQDTDNRRPGVWLKKISNRLAGHTSPHGQYTSEPAYFYHPDQDSRASSNASSPAPTLLDLPSTVKPPHLRVLMTQQKVITREGSPSPDHASAFTRTAFQDDEQELERDFVVVEKDVPSDERYGGRAISPTRHALGAGNSEAKQASCALHQPSGDEYGSPKDEPTVTPHRSSISHSLRKRRYSTPVSPVVHQKQTPGDDGPSRVLHYEPQLRSAGTEVGRDWIAQNRVTTKSPPSSASMSDKERRLRRAQLNKLNRMLGTRVPVELILMNNQSSIGKQAHGLTSESSRTVAATGQTRPMIPPTTDDGNEIEREERDMTPMEKRRAVKVASKMLALFGQVPPTESYHVSNRGGQQDAARGDAAALLDTDCCSDSMAASSLESYRFSLNSLQYLIDHDRPGLHDLLDRFEPGQEDEIVYYINVHSDTPTPATTDDNHDTSSHPIPPPSMRRRKGRAMSNPSSPSPRTTEGFLMDQQQPWRVDDTFFQRRRKAVKLTKFFGDARGVGTALSSTCCSDGEQQHQEQQPSATTTVTAHQEQEEERRPGVHDQGPSSSSSSSSPTGIRKLQRVLTEIEQGAQEDVLVGALEESGFEEVRTRVLAVKRSGDLVLV